MYVFGLSRIAPRRLNIVAPVLADIDFGNGTSVIVMLKVKRLEFQCFVIAQKRLNAEAPLALE